MPFRPRPPLWAKPSIVWLLVLVILFATEYTVMLVLPYFLPAPHARVLEASVDAILLTAILAPFMWWTLVRPLREVNRLRAQFLTQLFAQIEVDRRQVAHDLHDGVGQTLSLLISGLRSVSGQAGSDLQARAPSLLRLAEDSLAEVRRLARGLRPSLLDDLGLAPALEALAADIRAHHPVEVTLELAALDKGQLPEQVATAVFRIVQEALTNVVKHSGAAHARVTMERADDVITVHVVDDGVGIAPERLRTPKPGHLGIAGMRERATLVGGSFGIQSKLGQGTHVFAVIPISVR